MQTASTSGSRASFHRALPTRATGRTRVPGRATSSVVLAATAPQRTLGSSTGRSLVVAVDDTELSWESVKFTVEELYREGDVLHLLHVIPREDFRMPVPPAALGNMSYSSMDLEYEELLFQHAREFINGTMVELADARHAQYEIDLVHGNCRQSIGDMIISKSEALNASVVVVPGHHSPSIWEQLFAGNASAFSTHVAKYSRVPTLIYQPAVKHVDAQKNLDLDEQHLGASVAV